MRIKFKLSQNGIWRPINIAQVLSASALALLACRVDTTENDSQNTPFSLRWRASSTRSAYSFCHLNEGQSFVARSISRLGNKLGVCCCNADTCNPITKVTAESLRVLRHDITNPNHQERQQELNCAMLTSLRTSVIRIYGYSKQFCKWDSFKSMMVVCMSAPCIPNYMWVPGKVNI